MTSSRPARTSPRRAVRATFAAQALAATWLALAAPSLASAGDVLDLQPALRSSALDVRNASGRRGRVTLVEINPRINAWLVLQLQWGDSTTPMSFHLENPDPARTRIALGQDGSPHLALAGPGGTHRCEPWSGAPRSAIEDAAASGRAWAPLCEGRLLLRNRVAGRATTLERATDFLRDRVWGGERVIGFVRREFYADRYAERAVPSAGTADPSTRDAQPPGAPAAAEVNDAAGATAVAVEPGGLGIALEGVDAGLRLLPGRWYAARGLPGVFVSTMQPGAVAPSVLRSHGARVNPLDGVESAALAFLVAFDLSQFELGFALGTDHPRVGWADRVAPDVRTAQPGPDGIATIAPLVPNGMLDPALLPRVVATFTGGFKRQHGAMHDGELAHRNHGSHYGFVEQGALLSRLNPGLSTLYVLDDGTIDLKTWSAEDDARLPSVRHARQNGVPLIERVPGTAGTAPGVPGALVNRWSAGNWSGSADANLRTLRAGACLLPSQGRRFLVYGYFSTATPSAMVRVFQAYGCSDAMLLDMNALEHTYAALYPRAGERIVVEHLVRGMSVIDRSASGALVPRFLGMPDDRDFFYVLRREASR